MKKEESSRRAFSLGAQVFEALGGKWSLKRSMGAHGRLRGTAVFLRDENGLLYREEGVFSSNANREVQGSLSVYREYHYSLESGSIVVAFRDPSRWGSRYISLFFQDKGQGLWARDTHYCGQDIYQHFFFMPEQERFSTLTCVSGPHKSYTLKSFYRRLGD